MTQKWNLQDIRRPEPRRRPPVGSPRTAPRNDQPAKPTSYPDRDDVPSIVIEDGNRKEKSKMVWSVVIFVLIVGTALGLSAFMGSTELTVYPKYREPNVSAEFLAYPEKRDGELSYEIMTLEATGESQVTATGQVKVEEQATGVIEIVKTTPGAERLIKNTRFRTPDGLIYKIRESVVVPGAVKDDSGASVPGTIRASVFADDVGEQYNVPAGTTFDVPGFEEGGYTALYNAISARNPEPMTGGFSGQQYEINPDELATARQALQVQLRDTLLARIENERPAGFLVFPGAVAITYNQLPAVEYGNDLVTIKEQAILQIPLFEAVAFGSFLAKETVPTYAGNPVRVDDLSTLTFRYTNSTTSASVIANEPSLAFSLSGKPLLIWQFDAKKLAADLAGLPKTALGNVVRSYPGIESARARITPFWKRSFPEDPEEIVVVEEIGVENTSE